VSGSEYGLILDIQGAQSVAHGERGIARFVVEHAAALMRRSDRVRRLLLNPLQPFPGHLPAPLLSSPLLGWSTLSGLRRELGSGDVAVHVMSPFELPDPATAVVPDHLMRPDLPLIVTLYDLIPYLMQERYLADPAWKKRYLQRVETVRGADLVLAISEATRQDAIRELGMDPDTVVNIGGGVSPNFRPAPAGVDVFAAACRDARQIRRPYFFSVAGAEFRKNTERLIEAYAALPAAIRQGHQLVITCDLPKEWRRSWLDHARAHGCDQDDVVLTGRVGDEQLVRLYRGASLFVFPSLYEGFGLPVAEAIACGCPAVTSNVSSLPEILEHPPATFDPEDVADISRVMERGVSDAGFRSALVEAVRRRSPLFSWDAVADRTLDAICERIDSGRWQRSPLPPQRRNARPRVALVTPLPPEVGGIASYSARLLPALAEHMDLDVLHSNPETPTMSPIGVRELPLVGLGRYVNPHSYDAVVYAIGNSPHHVATYEKLLVHPGIVWLHDVRVPHLIWHYAASHGIEPGDYIADLLHRNYGMRYPARALTDWSVALCDRYGLGLTPAVVRGARGVIVHSALAERLLRLDLGPDAAAPPIRVVPHAAAPLRPGGPVGRRTPPVVGALGLVDERKSPLLLIDAIAEIPTADRPELVFIGPCEDWKRDWILTHATELGIAASVSFTGHVDPQGWWTAIDQLTCAVQLRVGTNGESSGSTRDAMARGVPVITNQVGVEEELPAGSLLALPAGVDATGLAVAIGEVCGDPAVWRRLSEAGWSYSAAVTEDVVAAELAAVITELAGRER
jgi:glycosyltransferase involved in cell wall biosynthesis